MTYSHEVEMMCPVTQGVHHGAAPIPEEAKWVKAKEIVCKDRRKFYRFSAVFAIFYQNRLDEWPIL